MAKYIKDVTKHDIYNLNQVIYMICFLEKYRYVCNDKYTKKHVVQLKTVMGLKGFG